LTFSESTLPYLAAAGGRGTFVGRAGELAVLEAAAAAVRGGQPKVVLVEGEAGIGKSSLLTRFAAGLAGATVLRASGDEAEPAGRAGRRGCWPRGWAAGWTRWRWAPSWSAG